MKNGGGHFAPELGGHFELELGGHFKLELGGQYHWNLHITTCGRIDGFLNNAGVNDEVGLENGNYNSFMKSL